jgi:glycosyltransferase involved in cell wall biosynthesis
VWSGWNGTSAPAPQVGRERKLKVCVLGSTYPRFHDDPVVPWLRESVGRVAARGHEVTVAAPSYKGLANHHIDGVRVLRFRYAPSFVESLTHDEGAPNKLRNPAYNLLAAPYIVSGAAHLAAWVVRQGFDVVHVHWPFPHSLLHVVSHKLRKTPRVATCHGAELAMARKSALVGGILRRSLLEAEVVSCNSSHTRNEIERLCGRKATVIPYGTTVATKDDPRPVPPEGEPAVLLFSGRLIQRKGIPYLIRALPRVLERRAVRVVITGEGDRRSEWEELASRMGLGDKVEFLGFVSNQRLAELYRTCDLYVHPAIFDDNDDTEGLGVVLVEALASRCPVVASAVGGIVDVIEHEKTGLLVPQKDEVALADAILRLLDDPALGRRLGEAGRAFAQSHFDWDRITDETETLYHLAVARAAERPKALEESSRRA